MKKQPLLAKQKNWILRILVEPVLVVAMQLLHLWPKNDYQECIIHHIAMWVGVKTWYENPDPILWHMKFHAAAYMKLNVWT